MFYYYYYYYYSYCSLLCLPVCLSVCVCVCVVRLCVRACGVDVDECRDGPAVCGVNGTCRNTDGSFRCTCHTGFQLSPATQQCTGTTTHQSSNNNNNNSRDNVYGAVIMTKVIAIESSPGSSDECRLSAGWPPTLRPSQSTWAVNPPKIGSYHPHPPSPLLLLLSP